MGIHFCWQVSISVPVAGIQSPCQHSAEMKDERKCKGEENFSCVIVCAYLFLSVVNLLCGGVMFFPMVMVFDCLFHGVQGHCVRYLGVLQLFCSSCYFRLGTHQLSLVGALLLIGHQVLGSDLGG